MRAVWMLLCLLLLAPISGRGALNDHSAQAGAAASYEDLQALCDHLLVSATATNMEALMRSYAAVTNAGIREAITAAMGLYWMAQQRVAEADRYADHLRRSFPNSKFQYLLEKEGNLVPCDRCKGIGQVVVDCPECGGSGKCRRCNGHGTIPGIASASATTFAPAGTTAGGVSLGAATIVHTPAHSGGGSVISIGAKPDPIATPMTQIPCPSCGATGKCKACKGLKTAKDMCPVCFGNGMVFNERARVAFVDVVNHLKNLAGAAAQSERGLTFAEGRWRDREDYERLQRWRADDRAYFGRVAEEAEHARDYETAVKLLDDAVKHRLDSPYTGDVQRLRAVIRAEAVETQPKELLGPQRAADAAAAAKQEIPFVVNALLNACRRQTNAPALCATNAAPRLPVEPMAWRVSEPVLLDRTARVAVEIDRPSHTGFPVPEPWTFLLVYERSWKVWQTASP